MRHACIYACKEGRRDYVSTTFVSSHRYTSIVYLGVIGPLVGHIEGGLDGAAVGVVAPTEQLLVERLNVIIELYQNKSKSRRAET